MRGMFYWKTVLTIDKREAGLLDSLDINTLYVRYFDVSGFDVAHCSPVQPLGFAQPLELGTYDVVPCVYIDDQVFRRGSDTSDIDLLAHRIARYMLEIDSVLTGFIPKGRRPYPKRLLMDCDWSPGTSKVYFALLNSIQRALPQTSVESTIRLWQYRNPELSGIPPVKRGLLMCYNMDDFRDPYVENAIASTTTLQRFVTKDAAKKYPLALDVAYPLYRQMRHFTADGSYPTVEATTEEIGSTYDHLSGGDVVRVDGVTPTTLIEMHEWNTSVIPKSQHVGTALFSLDTAEIRRLGVASIRKVLR